MSAQSEKPQTAAERDNEVPRAENSTSVKQKPDDESEKFQENADMLSEKETDTGLETGSRQQQDKGDKKAVEEFQGEKRHEARSIGTKHRNEGSSSGSGSGSSSRDHKRQDRHESVPEENTWLFSEESFLKYSPSRKQLTLAQELKTREAIHDFVIRLGTGLKLDGRTILAATIYLNRFYMRMPITTSKYFVACSAISIACKLNDNYRQPDMIALTGCKIKNPHKSIDSQSSVFWQWRDQILFREELILKNLNFELNLELPYAIRDDLMAAASNSSDWFYEKKTDALKHTVSLIEILSSLPLLVAYDIHTLFGALLVVVLEDAKKSFGSDTVVLPKSFLSQVLHVDARRCYKCYRYILRLLSFCKSDDPHLSSHKNAMVRVPHMDESTFSAIAND